MPRWLLEGRHWERIRQLERARQQRHVLEYFAATGRDAGFIDYYPDMLATRPEKIVFQALVERRINFYLAPYWGDFPFTPDKSEKSRPDFLLPDYKIIIEVLSVYWHSRAGVPNRDAVRNALYVASGYKVYYFTDEQIYENVDALLNTIPELVSPAITGDTHIIADRPQDPVAAIRARLKKWPKVVRTRRKYKRSLRDPLQRFRPTGRKPRKLHEQLYELHRELSQEMLERATTLHQEWSDYMTQLGAAVAHGYRGPYYNYYQRWKGYLNRFTM